MLSYAKMSKYKYPFYIVLHPNDGYQELKYNKKGSFRVSIIIVLLWYVSAVLNRQTLDFVFNPSRPEKLNLFMIAASTILIFTIAVISNWCFSTLMDGKGNLKDIWIVCSYALIPMIVTTFITIILSKGMILEEEVFLTYIKLIGVLWSAVLYFLSIQIVHDFSFIKTVNTILLTVLGMLIILFLFILIYSLFQQVIMFAGNIFYEIIYRFFSN